MAMVIKNNLIATQALHTLNENLGIMGKHMRRLATGMRIVDAEDGPSDYAISENMRVRLRALEQNDRNVQAGISMMRVAEGAVQSQLDIVRTIKEKVLDAANDTNTDDDRAIIQKEIDQGYDQLSDIAWGTTYNGKKVLIGDTWIGIQSAWAKRSKAEMIEDSGKLGIVGKTPNTTPPTPPTGYSLMSEYKLSDVSTVLEIGTEKTTGGSFTQEATSVLVVSGYGTLTGTEFTIKTTPATGGASLPPETYKFSSNPADDSDYVVYVNPGTSDIMTWLNAMANKMNSTSTYGYVASAIQGQNSIQGTLKVVSDRNGVYMSIMDYSLGPSVTQNGYSHTPYHETKAKLSMDFSNLTVEKLKSMEMGSAFKFTTPDGTTYLEFIDSSNENGLYGVQKIAGSKTMDIAEFISMGNGQAMREAFAQKVQSVLGNGSGYTSSVSGATITVESTEWGEDGNNKVTVQPVKAILSTYDGFDFNADTIDYNDPELAASLNSKGFHFYDAGKSNTWINVTFSDMEVEKVLGDRYPSGTATDDITTAVVDVTGVSDADSLVQAIYDQANAKLSGTNYRFAIDSSGSSKKLILYDARASAVSPLVYGAQAGVADGNYDNVIKRDYDIYAHQVHIQGAPESGQGTNLLLPQTTVDHIFCFSEGDHPITDFNVMTKEMRDALLGTKETKGILDRGIRYLLDAQTTVGAQISRMEMSHENIVLQQENLAASESIMRDADMAKEMTEMVKYRVLVQATQAMLAQANQQPASVLGLMQ